MTCCNIQLGVDTDYADGNSESDGTVATLKSEGTQETEIPTEEQSQQRIGNMR